MKTHVQFIKRLALRPKGLPIESPPITGSARITGCARITGHGLGFLIVIHLRSFGEYSGSG